MCDPIMKFAPIIFASIKRSVLDRFGSISMIIFNVTKKETASCQKSDVPHVINIYENAFNRRADTIFYKYQKLFHNTFYLVKDVNNNICGYCLYYIHLKIKNWKLVKVATLYSIAVEDNYKGRGVGSLLLKESINELKENSVSSIRLYVNVDNNIAIDLYTKYGFIVSDIKYNICGLNKKCYEMELITSDVNTRGGTKAILNNHTCLFE